MSTWAGGGTRDAEAVCVVVVVSVEISWVVMVVVVTCTLIVVIGVGVIVTVRVAVLVTVLVSIAISPQVVTVHGFLHLRLVYGVGWWLANDIFLPVKIWLHSSESQDICRRIVPSRFFTVSIRS